MLFIVVTMLSLEIHDFLTFNTVRARSVSDLYLKTYSSASTKFQKVQQVSLDRGGLALVNGLLSREIPLFRLLFLPLSAFEKFWLELVFVGQVLSWFVTLQSWTLTVFLFVLSTATLMPYLLVQLVRIQVFLLNVGSCPVHK